MMLRFTKFKKNILKNILRNIYLETIKKYYQVDKREISFLKFIFEAYDGIAILTTIDAKSGKIVLKIPPGCEADAEALMADMNKSIMIEPC